MKASQLVREIQEGINENKDWDVVCNRVEIDDVAWGMPSISDRELGAKPYVELLGRFQEPIDFEKFRPAVLAWQREGEQRYHENGVFHLKLGPNHFRAFELLDLIDSNQTKVGFSYG